MQEHRCSVQLIVKGSLLHHWRDWPITHSMCGENNWADQGWKQSVLTFPTPKCTAVFLKRPFNFYLKNSMSQSSPRLNLILHSAEDFRLSLSSLEALTSPKAANAFPVLTQPASSHPCASHPRLLFLVLDFRYIKHLEPLLADVSSLLLANNVKATKREIGMH